MQSLNKKFKEVKLSEKQSLEYYVRTSSLRTALRRIAIIEQQTIEKQPLKWKSSVSNPYCKIVILRKKQPLKMQSLTHQL